MPTLIENRTLADNAALCAELGLSFIELNMNFPEYQVERLEETEELCRIAEAAGVYYTIHLDENLNVADFNPLVAAAYRETVRRTVAAAKALLAACDCTLADAFTGQLALKAQQIGYKQLSQLTGAGEPTLRDIVKELEKPGRDPRSELPPPLLRTDVMEMDQLTPGMELKGTVRNVTDFGAFVDLGVHRDGLVHISQMALRRINHPSEVVRVGDIVTVWVLSVEKEKNRISLTMRRPGK